MAQGSRSRSERPVKPYPDSPLFPHATGRWAKKIRGRFAFFGPWADPEGALARYLAQRDELYAGRREERETCAAIGATLDMREQTVLRGQSRFLKGSPGGPEGLAWGRASSDAAASQGACGTAARASGSCRRRRSASDQPATPARIPEYYVHSLSVVVVVERERRATRAGVGS